VPARLFHVKRVLYRTTRNGRHEQPTVWAAPRATRNRMRGRCPIARGGKDYFAAGSYQSGQPEWIHILEEDGIVVRARRER